VTPPAPYFDGSQECRQSPELFFPPRQDSYRVTGLAKTICNRCPFQPECLEYALTENSVGVRWLEGIWAGTTERQRQRIREKRAA
jgi:hypothetical protein